MKSAAIGQIQRELQEIMADFKHKFNTESTMQTKSGRTYNLTVVTEKGEGIWAKAPELAKGYFTCKLCAANTLLPGGNYFRFKANDNSEVVLFERVIHLVESHPEKLSADAIQMLGRVFIGLADEKKTIS